MADDRLFPLTPTDIRLMKDLGKDASIAKLTAHDKLDNLKSTTDEILVDTADIHPRLINVENDIAALDGDISNLQASVDGISTDINDGNYGLDALNTKILTTIDQTDELEAALGKPLTGTVASHVEAIENNLGQTSNGTVASHVEAIETIIGTPSNGTVSADISQLDSKLGQIQNNTRTVIALNSQLELPEAGQTRYFKIILTNYDSAGGMEEPDSAPILNVETQTGASRDTNIGMWDGSTFSIGTSMQLVSEGRYAIFFRLPSTAAANEQLIFTFTIIENGMTRHIVRTAMTVEEISSTFTAADRVTLNTIDNTATDIQSRIGSPVNASVSADIAAVKAQTQSIENKSDIIDANIDTVKDSILPQIQTKASGTFNRDTMSLEAIAELLAVIAGDSTDKIWTGKKVSGTIAAGASETVVIDQASGMFSVAGILNTLIVNPTTSCTDFSIDIFEDSALNRRIAKISNWDSISDGWLAVTVNRAYVNAENEKKLYVRVTNNSAIPASFSVSLRGLRSFVAI